MNSHIWKCSQCNNKHTEINIKYDIINMNCQCGYHSTMRIKEFIKLSKVDKSQITINDDTLSNITTDIKNANKHLLTYFKEIKDEHISRTIAQMNRLESSYEESYNRNKDILTFLEILIDNYDGSNEMKQTILENELKIYQCKDRNNINEVIKYYNEYKIIQKKIIIEELKSITEHTSSVYSLLRLKDGRIASCSDDNTIKIYDPSNNYHCDKVIYRHSHFIPSICELNDGTIVSCSLDKSIIIGDYIINNAHNDCIFKVITLPNNRIASCSKDNRIKIWKSNPQYSDTPIKVLEGLSGVFCSILYIKERDIMISVSSEKTLLLWNMQTYKYDKVINGVECCWNNALYQIDSDRVIVGGFDSLCILNIDKCVIEKTIKDESIRNVGCFLKMKDNKTILCGCDNEIFCFYDMKKDEYIITKNSHNDYINDLLLIDEHTFLSCSKDKTIKLWKL